VVLPRQQLSDDNAIMNFLMSYVGKFDIMLPLRKLGQRIDESPWLGELDHFSWVTAYNRSVEKWRLRTHAAAPLHAVTNFRA
jgi:hypothetical protein